MSLYCFGKVIPINIEEALKNCVPDSGIAHLRTRNIDPEDLQIISEFGELKRVGIAFTYEDRQGDPCATELWLTASEVASRFSKAERDSLDADYADAIKATALGGFVWNLLNCHEIKHGAIALVDGGIEAIHQASAEDCWNHFLKIIPQPWDCHDNPLFVWSNEKS